jgi:hypothetical protein
MKRCITLLSLMLCWLNLFAQSAIQPTIMVIPYTKQGEDIRTVLEGDENKRIVLTKIKEAFDKRGFSTIDFEAKLKAIESGNTFNIDNQSDIKSQIIDMSGSDIYVEAEISCLQEDVGQPKKESRVKVIVTAYDSSTGASLSNKVGESGVFYTNDIAKLGMKAIESCADDFLKTMQEKFTAMAENGRSAMIQISLDENSSLNLESEIGTEGLQLQDEIELWVEQHAYNGSYHIQGSTGTKMIIDDFKMPPMDPKTGAAYNLRKLSIDFMKFFRGLNIPISRSTRGNTLYITIK